MRIAKGWRWGEGFKSTKGKESKKTEEVLLMWRWVHFYLFLAFALDASL